MSLARGDIVGIQIENGAGVRHVIGMNAARRQAQHGVAGVQVDRAVESQFTVERDDHRERRGLAAGGGLLGRRQREKRLERAACGRLEKR